MARTEDLGKITELNLKLEKQKENVANTQAELERVITLKGTAQLQQTIKNKLARQTAAVKVTQDYIKLLGGK